MTTRRFATATAATVAAALAVCVAPALAIRPATMQEAEAIQTDLGLADCDWQVGISTVDSAWARVEADPATCAEVSSVNTKAHFDGAHWTGSPWTFDIELLCPDDADIPPVVAGDLGLCVGPPAFPEVLPCDDRRSGAIVYRPQPRACSLATPSQAYGEVVNLRRLHWRAWGKRVARGWGAEVNEPVTIRAWRLRRVCGDKTGARAYTRMRIRSARGAVTVRRAVC